MNRSPLLVGAAALLAPALAHADPSLTASPFVTLDRQAGDSLIGAEIAYPVLKSDADNDTTPTILHFDVHAHYVDPGSHLGAYINVPINYLSLSESIDTNTTSTSSATALGDIELGGIYAASTPVPELAVILHAGLALPSGSKDNLLNNVIGEAYTRPRDLDVAIPGFTLRLGASPIVRSGNLFARADIDLDINLSNSDGDTAKPVLTLGGGVGVALSSLVLTGELTFVHSFEDASGDSTDDFNTVSTAAVSARFTGGTVHPYVAITLPLNSDVRDGEDVGLIAGVAAHLR